MERKNLLVAAGYSRAKKLFTPASGKEWCGVLVTVDINPSCGADILHDMGVRPFPFANDEFDEIHAYDCLEHWGQQGDWRGWFDEMGEYHRILKPGGEMSIIVPVGIETFADPGHTRFFSLNYFLFLEQAWYGQQIERGAPVSDYRAYWKKDFMVVAGQSLGVPAHHLGVILRKPA